MDFFEGYLSLVWGRFSIHIKGEAQYGHVDCFCLWTSFSSSFSTLKHQWNEYWMLGVCVYLCMYVFTYEKVFHPVYSCYWLYFWNEVPWYFSKSASQPNHRTLISDRSPFELTKQYILCDVSLKKTVSDQTVLALEETASKSWFILGSESSRTVVYFFVFFMFSVQCTAKQNSLKLEIKCFTSSTRIAAVSQSSCHTDTFRVSDAVIFNSFTFIYQTFNSI